MENQTVDYINKLQLIMARIPHSRYIGKKLCMKFSTHDYYIEGTIEKILYSPESKTWMYLFRYEDGSCSEEDSACLQSVMYLEEKTAQLKIINTSKKCDVIKLSDFKKRKKM